MLMAPVLGWDKAVIDREIAHYRARLWKPRPLHRLCSPMPAPTRSGRKCATRGWNTSAAREDRNVAADRTRTVWVNGRLEPAGKAALTVTDRGFQVGDGIFETIRVVGGRALELPFTPPGSRLPPPCSRSRFRTISSRRWTTPSLRCAAPTCWTVPVLKSWSGSRRAVGPVDGRGLRPPAEVRPNLVVQAWRVDPPASDLLERGLRLVIELYAATRRTRSHR